jgi:hypothetical protein
MNRSRATGLELRACGTLADLAETLLVDVMGRLDSAEAECAGVCGPNGVRREYTDTLHTARRLCARAGLVLARYRRAICALDARRRDA